MDNGKRYIESPIGLKFNEEESDALTFFIELNHVVPSWIKLIGPFMFNQFLDVIKKAYPDFVIDWTYTEYEYQQVLIRIKYKDGYILMRTRRTFSADEGLHLISKSQEKYIDKKYGVLLFSDIDIMFNQYSGFPQDLVDSINKIKVHRSEEINKIHLLVQDSDVGLYTKELPMVNADLTFDLDLHYGEGSAKFHELNIKRITEQNKGIILLHGSPGTGKSYYIRRLIRDLSKCKKNILYMPNNMVDMIGTPSFNNFLMDWVTDRFDDRDDKKPAGILLVIEDAERVLIKREINQYGADGVANILNSSDGILNDFLNIQVLATFNSDIKMIDEAILRKKRALSIKEFKKLTKEQAQKVIDHYKLDHTASGDMSLADIFSLKQDADDDILLVDNKSNVNQIGFGK